LHESPITSIAMSMTCSSQNNLQQQGIASTRSIEYCLTKPSY
jgi:hypothetical protein